MENNLNDKVEQVRRFLSNPLHKLIGSESEKGNLQLSKFFSIEISRSKPNIKFSESFVINGYEEAVDILDRVVSKAARLDIKVDVKMRMENAGLNPEDNFYLTFMGNKDYRMLNSEI